MCSGDFGQICGTVAGGGDRDWPSGKIESTLEEISLRATVMRQSLIP